MGSEFADRVDEFFTVEGVKKHWTVYLVSASFLLGLWLRYRPAEAMQYLQALDPYMIYRMSQHVAFDGALPQTDFLRYFPYNSPTYLLQQGDIFFPAVFYWLGPFLFFSSYMEWAQFYPAFMGAISVIFAYLLGKELYDKVAGVSSAFFIAVIAGIMHRTSAGFFEKEPVGTMFMMASLYFFTRAWKRKERFSGVLSGLSLAFFTISWGGSKMLWLLYPLTVGLAMLIDEDIEKLVKAYTPTVLVGGGVAAALNPTRFWFTGDLFLANFALLGFLWSRYLVGELEILEEGQLKLYTPVMSFIGVVLVALSPLYSDFIASRVMRLFNRAFQSGGKVIAGTVAENTPATLGQLITRLGATLSTQIHPYLGLLSNFVGSWPLAFIGVSLLGTSIAAMVLRKYGIFEEEIPSSTYYQLFGAVFLTWLIGFAWFFKASVVLAVGPAIVMVLAGYAVLYASGEFESTRKIEFRWYHLLPFLWVLTNVLGAVSKSRLVFLASFSVAVTAGYAFSVIAKRAWEIDYSFIDSDSTRKIRFGVLAMLVGLVVLVNGASGYASSNQISGSPHSAWMQNLDYMEQNTEKGDVILSWWDYGYWFESIGRRAAVADGGNMGYYKTGNLNKVNYPIADFFTSDDYRNHTDLFRKHSVDYLVLDSTMIGKYSAVSQIAHRDNSQFWSMNTVSTPGSMRQSMREENGNVVAQFGSRGLNVYVPLDTSGRNVTINSAPTLEAGGRGDIGCVLTESGVKEFNVSSPIQLPANYFGRNTGVNRVEVCVAEHPFRSFERGLALNQQAQLVLVPKPIADNSLIRLYLMDGHGIDYLEKVPGGSNGFVKMWEVKDLG